MSARSFETFPGKNFPCGILPKKVNFVEKKMLWQKSYAYMYIEQIRTYEIKKVAFKFNFLFLGYDIGHEKKIKNFVWWETSTFVSSLKFQCFISRIGKN